MDNQRDSDRGVRQRPLSVGDIQYFYIPKARPKTISGILPPDEFELPVLRMLVTFPTNLTQLNDPFIFYSENRSLCAVTPHRLSLFYPEDVQRAIDIDPYKSNLKIFFVDPLIPNLGEFISKLQGAFSFIYFINGKNPEDILGNKDHFVVSPWDLLGKLTTKKQLIEKLLLEQFPMRQIEFVINLPETEYHLSINPESRFRASFINFWTLNQILGNQWNSKIEISEEQEIHGAIKESEESLKKDPNDPHRLLLLIDQVKRFDELEIMVSEDRNTKFPNGKADCFAPIILILPFNFPNLGKILDYNLDPVELKRVTGIMNAEQSINYITYSKVTESNKEDLAGYASYLKSKTDYLDGVAYLHASFQNSPVVRFPTLGNSIKKELSFFKPETINDAKWKNSKALIDLFGSKLKELILPGDLDEQLFLNPRQIVAITDLPIEWLICKGGNLSYVRDVARLSETPYGGIMAAYGFQSNFVLSIGEDILSNTLVILGASTDSAEDAEMKFYFEDIEALSKKLGYKSCRCASMNDVIRQVELHRPEFLIFDVHGGFDPITLSSYLLINNERITGADIVKHKITAPIVFLSACHTNPNYGYLGKIADAFFEAGCLAITATYFPVSVKSATSIYMRILNNLAYASKKPMHRNWLEFISHVVRTSWFKDVINKTRFNVANSNYSDEDKSSIESRLREFDLNTSIKIMRNENRPKIQADFYGNLKKICPEHLVDKSTVQESYFYTHMGRPDLIRFKCWEREFYKLNDIKGDFVTKFMEQMN